jgi:hypothetical protein
MDKKIKIVKNQKELDELIHSNFDGLIIISQDTAEKISVFKKAKAEIQISGNARVNSVHGNAQINYVYGNARIGYIYDSAQINCVYGNAQIHSVSGNAQINNVYGSARIRSIHDNVQINIYPSNARIKRASDNSILIYHDGQKLNGLKRDKNVQVIRTKTFQERNFTISKFIDKYAVEKEDDFIILYHSVRDNWTDHYTGTISYEPGRIAEAPDWDENFTGECGHGLHMAATPLLAFYFNEGKVVKCRVKVADCRTVKVPLFPYKVRCSKVEVLEECKEPFE